MAKKKQSPANPKPQPKPGKPRLGNGVQTPRRLSLEDHYMTELRALGRGSASAGVRLLVDFVCRPDRGFRPTFEAWRDKNHPDFESWREAKARA